MSQIHNDFNRFLQHISPRADELARANERVRMIRDRINQALPVMENIRDLDNLVERWPDNPHIWLDPDVKFPAPVYLLRKDLMGSAARQTLLHPVKDVDILLILQCENAATLASWTSRGLLNSLRETLNGIGTKAVVHEGECVTVKFADRPYCDVFPAFNMLNRPTLLFPKVARTGPGLGGLGVGGGWFKANPWILDQLVKQTDDKFGGLLRPFIKLLKRWNKVHKVGLKSFHLEAMATRFPREDHVMPRWLYSFFLPAKQDGVSYIEMPSPDRDARDMSQYLTRAEKQTVIEKMIYAEELCRSAGAALYHDDDRTAIRFFRKLLGKDFGC
jgi:hypothetical protein